MAICYFEAGISVIGHTMNMKKLMLLAGLTAFCGMASGAAFSLSMPADTNDYLMSEPSDGGASELGDANIYTGSATDFDYYESAEEQAEGSVNQYSKKYKKKFKWTKDGGLLPSFAYKFQFVPVAGNDIDNVVLRFITPAALTGCASIQQPAMTIEEHPPSLTLKLTSIPVVQVNDDVRYAPYHCDKYRKFAQIDLPLSHAALVEKGINKIILNGAAGVSRMYDVNTEGNKIEVMSGTEIAVFPADANQ